MAYEFRTTRTVEFAETDMAGILHFSNYFRYMEECEHKFFRSMGASVHTAARDGAFGAARIQATCDYRAPLRYEDVVELHLLVTEKRTRSVRYEVRFRKGDTEVARGSMVVVFIGHPEPGSAELSAMPIPPEVDAWLEVAPPDALA